MSIYATTLNYQKVDDMLNTRGTRLHTLDPRGQCLEAIFLTRLEMAPN